MKRNAIIKAAGQIEDDAKLQAGLAPLHSDEAASWHGVRGNANALANNACESRWTVKALKARLRSLRATVKALAGTRTALA